MLVRVQMVSIKKEKRMRFTITISADTTKSCFVEAETVEAALIKVARIIQTIDIVEHDKKLIGEGRKLLVNPPIVGTNKETSRK